MYIVLLYGLQAAIKVFPLVSLASIELPLLFNLGTIQLFKFSPSYNKCWSSFTSDFISGSFLFLFFKALIVVITILFYAGVFGLFYKLSYFFIYLCYLRAACYIGFFKCVHFFLFLFLFYFRVHTLSVRECFAVKVPVVTNGSLQMLI